SLHVIVCLSLHDALPIHVRIILSRLAADSFLKLYLLINLSLHHVRHLHHGFHHDYRVRHGCHDDHHGCHDDRHLRFHHVFWCWVSDRCSVTSHVYRKLHLYRSTLLHPASRVVSTRSTARYRCAHARYGRTLSPPSTARYAPSRHHLHHQHPRFRYLRPPAV